MRYPNEYLMIHDFCKEHGIEFHAYLCDYHSDRYVSDNPHSSAKLASYLVHTLHKQDMEEIDYYTIAKYSGINKEEKLVEELGKRVGEFRRNG